MTRVPRKSRHPAILAAAVLLASLTVAITGIPAHAQDESITVSCFKGNLGEGNYIGNLTVTVPENAGPLCNSTYYDCQGKCIGCFTDPKLDKQVCYDNTGTKIVK